MWKPLRVSCRESMSSARILRRLGLLAASSLLIVCAASDRAPALDPHRDPGTFRQQSWSTENGLPQNTVQAIAQTRDGYIWLGTEAGLARFDGLSFRIFDRQSTPQIRSNDIRAMAEDQDGALWIASAAGLLRFSRGQFRTFTANDGLPSDAIQSLWVDRQHNLWVATARGLARFKDGAFVSYRDVVANVLFEDHNGTIWVGTPTGLSRWQSEALVDQPLPEPLAGRGVTAVAEDNRG